MLTALGLLALAFLAGSGPAVQAEPAPEWNARFAGKSGWIGGDGVATAVLGRDRILWLFDDSIIGQVKDGGRSGAVMVNNSLAIQSGRGKDAALRFMTGKDRDGKTAAFFAPSDRQRWFWPQSAVRAQNKLYIFLARVERTKDKGVFGFRHCAQSLAVVDNPDDDPEHWRIDKLKLPCAEFTPARERSWGSAVLVHDDMLYVYGYLDEKQGIGRRQLTIARVPIAKIEDFTAWRFLAKTGWSKEASDAAGVANGLATEFTVSRLGERFVLVYTQNGLSDRIVGRFAKGPDGPWSEPVLLYRCPEMAKDNGVFTYAGKAHAWASPDRLLVSYCTNTWDFGRLFRDETVYRPRFVWVKVQR